MKPQIPNNIREKIKTYIKNNIDISPLIKDYSLKDENLSGAIIKELLSRDEDLSHCNFSNCIIGDENNITSIIKCNLEGCNFYNTKFIGKAWMRSCNAKNCNFKGADISNIEFQHTDFRGSSFCNAKITISTRGGVGCIFDNNLFKDLCDGWNISVEVKEKK
jgi:uncharacterized protein YjbI with pentapeptide repeats